MKYSIAYIFLFLGLMFVACDDGIDPITQVAPGADESAPQITINYPTEGAEIKVFEDVTTLDVDLKVTDDIEVKDIKVLLDGSQIANFNSFTDYRIVLKTFTYDHLVDGDHKLTVTATDLEGKTTTQEVSFTKAPPYQPMFEGEKLYMPFDGDYMDLISFQQATKVGNPGFSGKGFIGSDAYKGAADSYLTFPMDGLKSGEFSGAFWYKVNATPDRAGILVVGDNADDRNQGFRLFREGNGAEQRIKLNVGNGTGDYWNDGGTIDVAAGEWVHVAFSISQAGSTIYFNGAEMLTTTFVGPIDWTGCETLTIGSGGPTFDYWDHKSDLSDIDELRLFDRALTATDVQIMINAANPYIPQYDGESLYMPFDGDFINLIASKAAVPVGSPGFTPDAQVGSEAYAGATDSYLTYPSAGLTSSEFSASFWYKVNADPDRAGILVIGDDEADRNQGFRLFREASGAEQQIKLNVGTGSSDIWNDGGLIDPAAGEWVHVAITISSDENTIYLNGAPVRTSSMPAPIDWTGVGDFVIGSGGPTFNYWDHNSDLSDIDDLRFFSKALTPEEVAEVAGGTYTPKNFGATFYLPFDTDFNDANNGVAATVEGTPELSATAKVGTNAYLGATDSYLSFPIADIFGDQFSGAFWYKLNGDPDRAGIITVGPPMDGADNDLSAGFRLFREASDANQRIKLHVGTVEDNVWNDGDVLDPASGEWVHIAFTVSDTETKIYFNGVAVDNTGDMSSKTMNWANCTTLSIGSGAPNFVGWDHLSDLSEIDDLYLFNKVLAPDEVIQIMNHQ